MRGWLRAAAWLLPLCVVGSGCRSGAPKTEVYSVRGAIVSVDPTGQSVMLDAEAIPGFMEAMAMSYRLEDPSVAPELHPGDKIAAKLVVEHNAVGAMTMKLRDVVITAQGKPDYKPAVQYHEPAPGDSVPDFKLLNQSARTIHLAQFRGKVLVVTFVYTRCPLADYCPRMSRNFAEIDKALAGDPKVYAKTHLLSVSFDPTYDTPKVLKSYGEAYTGKFTEEKFEHWDFAAPQGDELTKMEQWFSVGVTPGDNQTLQHSLSTVVIGEDGKVVAFYPTNDWTVEEALKEIRGAVV